MSRTIRARFLTDGRTPRNPAAKSLRLFKRKYEPQRKPYSRKGYRITVRLEA
jgi:hypothetical protein